MVMVVVVVTVGTNFISVLPNNSIARSKWILTFQVDTALMAVEVEEVFYRFISTIENVM